MVAYTLEPKDRSRVQTLMLHESYVTPIAVKVADPDGPPSRRTRQSSASASVPRERTLLHVCADKAERGKGAVDVDAKRRFSAVQLSEHAVVAVSQLYPIRAWPLSRRGGDGAQQADSGGGVHACVATSGYLRAMPHGHEQIRAAAHTVQITSLTRAQSQRASEL